MSTEVFDPTWFRSGVDVRAKLRDQMGVKTGDRLHFVSREYLRFLELGGELRYEELNPELLRRLLEPGAPVLTGLSATYLYGCAREVDDGTRAYYDDVRDQWKLQSLRPIATSEIPDEHRHFVMEQARQYFALPSRVRCPREFRYDMAILWREVDDMAPSNERAIRRFQKAAAAQGIDTDLITEDDYGRIAEYDALFIRETTGVNHHTYRFARRAVAEGLVMMDDPESIVRCGDKVYQAELFERHDVLCPPTMVVHEENADEVGSRIGFPCVLKKPDGSFSKGIALVKSAQELAARLPALFEESELVVAQGFVPSSFDWRVGVLDRKPLYVCKYHMATGHWQIAHNALGRQTRFGRVEIFRVANAPPAAVELGVRAAALFGDGLYGVDIKEVGGRFLVMEINDNPNVDVGVEDAIAKDALYDAIMRWFRRRLDARGSDSSVLPE